MSETEVKDETGDQQSSKRVRRVIEARPDVALSASIIFGLLAAVSFVVAADQLDLGMVVLGVIGGTTFGGCSLLILNELMVLELDAEEGKPPTRRSEAAGIMFRLFSHRRVLAFVGLALLVAIGLLGPTMPGLQDAIGFKVFGQSMATMAAVLGVAMFTGWSLVLFLELERGVLDCPQCWLIGGTVLALGGAIIWGVTQGTMRTAGAILTVVGLVGLKMAFPVLLDQIDTGSHIVRDPKATAANRRVRAIEATAGGAVAAIGGALLMIVGAGVERSMYLTIGLLAVVGGLSAVGISAPRLVAPLWAEQSFSDHWLRLVTTALVAVGSLAIVWGATRTVEAAGDWLLLVLVICVVLIGLGAWFSYRGEALVVLALITFLLPWIMKDRASIEPAELNLLGNAELIAFTDQSRQNATTGESDGIIVALGDSFMSGEGADEYFRGTNTPATNQCRRAPTAYAVTVAEQADRELRFLACSGAKTENIVLNGVGQMPAQSDEVAGGRPQLQTLRDEIELTRRNGNKLKIDLVLLSIGGNDTGFSKIIQACLLPTNCAENEELWTAKAESLQDDLAETYRQVRSVVGRDVPILVVPYPEFISPQACDKLAGREEFEFVGRFIRVLNNTIHRAAKQEGVLVADLSGVFEERKQCDPNPAVNLIVLSPPSGANVLDRLGPGNWIHNSMHPRPEGHALQAERLGPLVRDLVDACGADDVDCRPECIFPNADVVERQMTGDGEANPARLIDNCRPADPVTPSDQLLARTEAADLLLATVVNTELYQTAGLLITPFLALVAGGLVLAIGLAGRPRTFGHVARFLSPIIPAVPHVEFADHQVHLIGQAAGEERASVLVVAPRPEHDPPKSVHLEARDGNGQRVEAAIDIGDWHYVEAGRNPYHWTKATISGLKPGHQYEIKRAEPAADGTARSTGAGVEQNVRPARVATLPRSASRFSLIVGSCYYRSSEHSGDLVDAYESLATNDNREDLVGFDGPLYHFWLGDQVYLDVPWKTGFRAVDIEDQVAKRYLDNWEIGTATPDPEDDEHTPEYRDPGKRFGQLLRNSSNWFLPDDHEFWNGYPQVSYLTLPRHALSRRLKNLRNDAGHPFAQGKFGRAAGRSYLIFQSPADVDPKSGQFESESEGEPIRPDPIQEIPLIDAGNGGPSARIIMVDTRWGRTIAAGNKGRFMPEDDMNGLEQRLERPGLVVLMLSRPLAGYPAKARRFGSEQVTEHYEAQYRQLLAAVRARVEAGQPTAVIAGDVHDSSMYSVAQGRLVQIVSSPIVLHGEPGSNPNPFLFEGLDEAGADVDRPNDFRDLLPDLDGSTGGLVRLDIDADDPARPTIHYRYHTLDPKVCEKEQYCRLVWVEVDGQDRWRREIEPDPAE